MHWSWNEFEDTPMDVLEVLIDMLVQEQHDREAAEQKNEFLKQHGLHK